MAGHSKWATTKHKKAALDAKRGKLFARLVKNIEVAARTGGADPAGNPTLYDAIQKAKKNSVPADNIDRAVKRGSGAEAGGADYETIMYEGYAPGGVAVLVECLTDNRNRAASDVRVAFTRNGGTLADPGSVSYLFNRRGVVLVPQTDGLTEDDVLAAVLGAGAEEVTDLGETFEVLSEATDVVAVRTALQDAGLDYDSAEAQFVPSMEVEVDVDGARKVIKLIEALEESDDVQNVFANFDASDEVMAALDEEIPALEDRLRSAVLVPTPPAGTDAEIVTQLEQVYQAAHESEEFQTWLQEEAAPAEIDADHEGDTFFPDLDPSWRCTRREVRDGFTFSRYEKQL